ncbi:MAG: hypothetical protein ACI9NC_006319, partial [Verrucomicrobiales bacterium]
MLAGERGNEVRWYELAELGQHWLLRFGWCFFAATSRWL